MPKKNNFQKLPPKPKPRQAELAPPAVSHPSGAPFQAHPEKGAFNTRLLKLGFYAVAALLALLGQWQVISANFGAGLGLTALGVAVFLLSRVRWERAQSWAVSWREPLQRLAEKWDQVSTTSSPAPRAPLAIKTGPAPDPRPVPKAQDKPRESAAKIFSQLQGVTVTVPKSWLLLAGVALIVFSQPLLYFEKFVPALGMLVPGVGFLLAGLFSKPQGLTVGRADKLLRFFLLALPGLALMVAGHLVLNQNLEINFSNEILGNVLNTAGILLLIALLPKVMPDPEASGVDPLDQPSGEAKGPWGVWIKAAWVVAAVVSFFLAAQSGKSSPALYWSLAGLACLAMSFPWARAKAATPEQEPDRAKAFVFKFLRLGLFLLALFLGYHGQSLIAKEQLFPGLYYFAAAAFALMLALREPVPGAPDPGRETKLHWAWEAAGLLVILGVGLYLRTHLLSIMPYGVECDEAGAGSDTLDILKNQFSSTAVHPSGRPLFMLLPNVVAFRFFGFDNIGLRFAAMAFGVIGILVMYLLARHFYGPRIALACSALFAVSRWHIHFSRFGWGNTLMLVLLMTGFYFLVKGLASRRKWFFVLAGVSFGLTIQTETAARMLPIICVALLGYLIVTQRHFFKRQGLPLVALLLGVWLVATGIFVFWLHKPNLLYKRVYEVSVFSEDPNAPRADVAKALIDSAKWSLTQLNWHGDYRTRHNGGLSGEPVADFWTAILFALGLGYSLFHWKRLRHFLPLLWFFGLMGASIFAIEAPQSHRAFGIFPTVFLFIGAFLDRARRLLAETLGRWGVAAGGLVFLILLVPITRINATKYFDAFPAFDCNVTQAAKYMSRAWPNAEHDVFTAYTWLGHWPFKLYARDIVNSPKTHLYYSASDAVPYRHAEVPTDVCYSFIMEYPPLLPTVRWFYPGGKFEEENHPKYGLQFQGWGVPAAEIKRTQGLVARYYANPDWAGKPALQKQDTHFKLTWDAKTWPLPGSGSVAWDGTLLIPHEGTYTFYVSSTDYAEMTLGGRTLQTGGNQEVQKTFYLAGGLHRIKIRARHATPGGKLAILWSCASETVYYLYDDAFSKPFYRQPLSPTHVFAYPDPVGLLGSFYTTPDWRGQPMVQKIEPALFFYWSVAPYGLPVPFSADWKGWIDISQAGEYRFDLEPATYGEMEIDGRLVVSKGIPPKGWTPAAHAVNPVRLEPGRHAVTVRWSTSSGFSFKWWWTPPGKKAAEVVPAWVLTPAGE